MRPESLHRDHRHRVTLFRGGGDGQHAVVCFEHGRDRMAGFGPAAAPRFAARLGIDALMVQTARRDWFLSDRSAALAAALEQATRHYAEVTATGFSMGGYAALLYSAACRAVRVMAVSPQYCIDPRLAPFDPGRHGKFARLGRPMPPPEAWGNPLLRGALIYDPAIRADRGHAALIRAGFARLTPIALPFGGHPATGAVAAAEGGIGRMAEMVVLDRLDGGLVRQMHRDARRRADTYRLNLARAALARHPARALAELRALAGSAPPPIRFEAGLLLLERGDEGAAMQLSHLLEEMTAVPPAWQRRLNRALRAAGV